MSEQRTVARAAYDTKAKVPRRKQFLREKDAVIPGGDLHALIVPHYPVAGKGRR
jgi:hypothetical protein